MAETETTAAPAAAPSRGRKLLVATKLIKRDGDEPILTGTLIDASAERAKSLDSRTRVATKTDEALAGPQRVVLD